MDYRKLYKEHYGIEFGSDYEVHHLDLDHKNDDIENLLLLPIQLHRKYHLSLSGLPIENGKIAISTQIKGAIQRGNAYNSYIVSKLDDFVGAYYECQIWMDYKHYLDGKIPNIHGIQLGGAA